MFHCCLVSVAYLHLHIPNQDQIERTPRYPQAVKGVYLSHIHNAYRNPSRIKYEHAHKKHRKPPLKRVL